MKAEKKHQDMTREELLKAVERIQQEAAASNMYAVELIEQTQEQSKRINDIFDSFPGFVSLIDTELNYILVNDIIAHTFGLKKSDFNNKKLGFLEGDTEQGLRALTETFIKSGKSQDLVEQTIQVKETTLTLLITFKLINDAKEIIIVSQDYTEQKNAQQVILEQKEKLAKAARFSAIGEAAAYVGHEIMNPLAVIMGYSQALGAMIDGQNLDQDKAKIMLEKISKQATRIEKIVASIKRISRDGSGDEKEDITLYDFFEDALDVCRDRLKNMNINITLPQNLNEHKINGQRIALSQVVLNMINNSVDAINELKEKWIKVEITINDDHYLLNFIDSGPGIPSEIADKIFETSFTTKPKDKGTGLGLSIIQEILQKHGGGIILDKNSPNTKFVLKLAK